MPAGDISQSLINMLGVRLGDPSHVIYEPTELYGYLNLAQLRLGNDVPDVAIYPLTKIRVGTWLAATYAYDLPADFLRDRYVDVNGEVAIRVALTDLDAIRANNYWAASKTRPFYALSDGKLQFYTGNEDPVQLVYRLFYMAKPMQVRAISTAARTTNVVTIVTVAAHGLTSALNVGDSIAVEDVAPAGATNFNGSFTIASVTPPSTLTYAQTAGNDTGSGGRLVNTQRRQISSTEDPILPESMHLLLLDQAMARAREQGQNWPEKARMLAHYLEGVQAVNSRYGGKPPFDKVPGDPGSLRTAQ